MDPSKYIYTRNPRHSTPLAVQYQRPQRIDFLENEYSLVHELYKNGTTLYIDFQFLLSLKKKKNQRRASKIH